MALSIERAMDDLSRIERKISMYQGQKKVAMERLKQAENEEIIKTVRGLSLSREDLIGLLKGLQEGTLHIDNLKRDAAEVKQDEPAGSEEGRSIQNSPDVDRLDQAEETPVMEPGTVQ